MKNLFTKMGKIKKEPGLALAGIKKVTLGVDDKLGLEHRWSNEKKTKTKIPERFQHNFFWVDGMQEIMFFVLFEQN